METNHRNTPGGHNAHMMFTDHLKRGHLERAEAIHAMHRSKMGSHGVLVEATPMMEHVNMEAAYRAHHDGHEFGTVLHAMSTPHELKALHEARARVSTAQEHPVPKTTYNEIL